MMKKAYAFLFLLVLLLDLGAHAQLRCESVLLTSHGDRQVVVEELARMYVEILDMQNPSEKLLAVNDYKRKLQEVSGVWGPQIKNEVAQSVQSRMVSHLQDKDQQAEKLAERRTRDNEILRWSRVKRHSEVQYPGSVLSENQILAAKDGHLVIYDFKQQKIIREFDTAKSRSMQIEEHTNILITPDRQQAVLLYKNTLQIVDLQSGHEQHVEIPDVHARRAMSLSRDGKFIYIGRRLRSKDMIFSVTKLKQGKV